MAFGQSGPSATARQTQQLLTLLEQAGHSGFRDARGPMGFTQRQAAGKFTPQEADEFITRLENEAEQAELDLSAALRAPDGIDASFAVQASRAMSKAEREEAKRVEALRAMPAGLLAAELERRNWVVIPPA